MMFYQLIVLLKSEVDAKDFDSKLVNLLEKQSINIVKSNFFKYQNKNYKVKIVKIEPSENNLNKPIEIIKFLRQNLTYQIKVLRLIKLLVNNEEDFLNIPMNIITTNKKE